jgi:CRISPR-associated helicase Cas3
VNRSLNAVAGKTYQSVAVDEPSVPPATLTRGTVFSSRIHALALQCADATRSHLYITHVLDVAQRWRESIISNSNGLPDRLRSLLSGHCEDGSPLEILTKRLSGLNSTNFGIPIAISTLRGQFADNREWTADPSRPGVIAGTVDMIGSRLLLSRYGIGFRSRPLHAGFFGQDALLVHDEAHLEPAFQLCLGLTSHESE